MPKQPEVALIHEDSSPRENDSNSVTSIDRAATILICLSEGANSITELANNSNLGKSTVHRILNTLTKSRFVTYDSVNHRYYLGPLVTRLSANLQTAHQYLLMRAMTEMKNLSEATKETISLSLLIGTEISVLYSIPSKYGLKVLEIEGEAGERGSVIPFGSSAKVLLSQLNSKTLKRTLDVIRISNPDFDELVDIEQLHIQLKQIKKDGYSLSRGERILGAMSVSVPVKNYTCPASLNVLGPERRISPNIQQMIKELNGAASRLSADILEKF
jgi:DNA-binding IclR family transcriptional regulator